MSIKTDVILAAGVGGMAPNLLKIALLVTAGPPVTMPDVAFILTYAFGLVILALLGAFTAWALKETNLRKALFIGMGLPAFFQVSASNISQIYVPKTDVAAVQKTSLISSPFFIGIAYAEQVKSVKKPVIAAKTLNVRVTGNKIPDSIVFFSANHKLTQSIPITSTDTAKIIELPILPEAQSFNLNYNKTASQGIALESINLKSTITVKVEENVWSGLLQAIGFQNAEKYKISVYEKNGGKEE